MGHTDFHNMEKKKNTMEVNGDCHFSKYLLLCSAEERISWLEQLEGINYFFYLRVNCHVKSSHIYLYSAFYNTDCFKAALQ